MFSPIKVRQKPAFSTINWINSLVNDHNFISLKGLIGCLIVCKKGTLEENRPWKRKDVDHEFCLRFALTDEGLSWYFNENKNLAGNASTIDASKCVVFSQSVNRTIIY